MVLKESKYKNICLLCLIALLSVLSACEEETLVTVMSDSSQKKSLTISRMAIGDKVQVSSARIIVFDNNKQFVSNTYIPLGNTTTESNILTLPSDNSTIEVKIGKNYIFVVLNEAAAKLDLDNITNYVDMNNIRIGKISYDELIPVSDPEPEFVMCVYDEVNVDNSTTMIDLTGLNTESKGFSMRRTMAKVVLESIWGGVKPDGKNTILGTEMSYDPVSTSDQTGDGDKVSIDQNGNISGGNTALAATSEIFVTKIELLNIPEKYSWAQEKNNSQDQTVYTGGYLEPLDISSGFKFKANYLDRTWHGGITVNGTVDFSRTDFMPSIWRQEENSSGSNSYGINEAYPFDNKDGEGNYGTNGPFVLNSGNFVPWVKEVYGNNEYKEGEIVPENLQLTSNLNPAVWSINGNVAYYIPENVQHTALSDNSNHTKLRIYFCIGTIIAEISDEEIRAIIDAALDQDKVPIVGGDGETLIINDNDNWQSAGIKYVTSQGKFVANTSTLGDGKLSNGQTIEVSKDKEWGICYEGLKTIWHGNGVKVTDRSGEYYVDKTKSFYIDVPLNNDTNNQNIDDTQGADDHNVYRGHEYRVKLYVTKSNEKWPKQTNTASRSINIGGEELTITGKVVSTPMN